MPTKPKLNYSAGVVQKRDTFSTPNYAIELLLPCVNPRFEVIWECASGEGKISNVFSELGYRTFSSDIRLPEKNRIVNFLTDPIPDELILDWNATCIVTNPPFSQKKQFFNKCIEYSIPFALLIPFDMAGWLWTAFHDYGCQGIVPNRRIDFITPNGKSGKESSAQFHSFWLCRYFNLSNQLEFVELSREMKQDV